MRETDGAKNRESADHRDQRETLAPPFTGRPYPSRPFQSCVGMAAKLRLRQLRWCVVKWNPANTARFRGFH